MKQIIVLCAIVALVWPNIEAGTLQTSEDGSQYFIEAAHKFNWYEALNECTRMKMSLVAIDSHAKHLQISNMMNKIFATHNDHWLWSGGNDHANTGRYEWISTGHGFSYTNWNVGEPNIKEEHCVVIVANNWLDAMCSTKCGFICELNSVVAEKNAELETLQAAFDTQTKQLMKKTESTEMLWHKYEELEKAMRIHELQVNQTLKENTAELDVLKKSNEMLTKQLLTEKNKIVDALIKSYDRTPVQSGKFE